MVLAGDDVYYTISHEVREFYHIQSKTTLCLLSRSSKKIRQQAMQTKQALWSLQIQPANNPLDLVLIFIVLRNLKNNLLKLRRKSCIQQKIRKQFSSIFQRTNASI